MINPSDIKPGAQFLTRDGRVVKIVRHDDTDARYPWQSMDEGGETSWLTPKGLYNHNEDYHPDDLISLHKPPMNTQKTYWTEPKHPVVAKAIWQYAKESGFRCDPIGERFLEKEGVTIQLFPENHNSHISITTTRDNMPSAWQEVSVPGFLALFDKPKSVEVKLNDNHTAIVSADTVKVGCQTFPASIISELAEAHNKVLGGEA